MMLPFKLSFIESVVPTDFMSCLVLTISKSFSFSFNPVAKSCRTLERFKDEVS